MDNRKFIMDIIINKTTLYKVLAKTDLVIQLKMPGGTVNGSGLSESLTGLAPLAFRWGASLNVSATVIPSAAVPHSL